MQQTWPVWLSPELTLMASSILTLDYYLTNNPGFRISAGVGYGCYTFSYLFTWFITSRRDKGLSDYRQYGK